MPDSIYTVLPENAQFIGFQLVTEPRLGRLMMGDRPLHVGDRFTQDDINNGVVRYEHTVKLKQGETQATDTFRFVLTDNGSLVTDPAGFTSCMPVPEIPFPKDGVYEFAIRINGKPFPEGSSLDVQVSEGSTKLLTDFNINMSAQGSTRGQIIHELSRRPSQGSLFLNGKPATMFTQQDVFEGRVSYHHQGPELSDLFEVTTCTQYSKCIKQVIRVGVTEGLHITGDNVFYAKVSSKWHQPLTANRDPLLWELVGGDLNAPYLSTTVTGSITWSYYDVQYSNAPATSPLRGLGYDKLPQYRNLPFHYQWNGGLPYGTYVDNANGVIWTANRFPYNPDEDSTWKLPANPSVFNWTMRVTDPYTGDTATREFTLYVTTSGRGPNGQTSETI